MAIGMDNLTYREKYRTPLDSSALPQTKLLLNEGWSGKGTAPESVVFNALPRLCSKPLSVSLPRLLEGKPTWQEKRLPTAHGSLSNEVQRIRMDTRCGHGRGYKTPVPWVDLSSGFLSDPNDSRGDSPEPPSNTGRH